MDHIAPCLQLIVFSLLWVVAALFVASHIFVAPESDDSFVKPTWTVKEGAYTDLHLTNYGLPCHDCLTLQRQVDLYGNLSCLLPPRRLIAHLFCFS